MNTIKCKYNWDEATVEMLFSDGTKIALLCKFVGCKGTLYIGKSQHKSPGKRFIMLTDNKDFRLTTGYGDIEHIHIHNQIIL